MSPFAVWMVAMYVLVVSIVIAGASVQTWVARSQVACPPGATVTPGVKSPLSVVLLAAKLANAISAKLRIQQMAIRPPAEMSSQFHHSKPRLRGGGGGA